MVLSYVEASENQSNRASAACLCCVTVGSYRVSVGEDMNTMRSHLRCYKQM